MSAYQRAVESATFPPSLDGSLIAAIVASSFVSLSSRSGTTKNVRSASSTGSDFAPS
jgi:hypothetical protein